jgi:hypothetical protein
MSWFRSEPVHKRLARALEADRPKAPWQEVGIHGISRPREWDDVRTVEVATRGERAQFVVLDDVIVIEEGPDDVSALADAVQLEPPFRAEAVRRHEDVWAVAAKRIEVERLPGATADEFDEHDGRVVRRARRIDGDLFEIESLKL